MTKQSNMVKVAVIGGEGIGPEVTAQSHRILDWFAARRGVPVTLREAQCGLIPYLATGKVLPEDTVEAMDEADAILWGAGKGIANPLGSILSVAMMLRLSMNHPDDADLLEKAVQMALAGGARAADIAQPGIRKLSTVEMGDAVLNALAKVAGREREHA